VGTVYRTADAGNGWTSLDGSTVLTGSSTVAVAVPSWGDGTVFASKALWILRSANRGDSWAIARSNCFFPRPVVFAPARPGLVYAICHGTDVPSPLLVSEDRGVTWAERGTLMLHFRDPAALVANPADPDRLYFASQAGVQGSSDGGRTWSSLLAEPSRLVLVNEREPAVVYAIGQGAWKSTDGGTHWQALPGAPQGRRWALDPADPGLVYVATGADLYVTRTGGM
jgi:photosystem II stability/assembly factor-like uncharacterized protein